MISLIGPVIRCLVYFKFVIAVDTLVQECSCFCRELGSSNFPFVNIYSSCRRQA